MIFYKLYHSQVGLEMRLLVCELHLSQSVLADVKGEVRKADRQMPGAWNVDVIR